MAINAGASRRIIIAIFGSIGLLLAIGDRCAAADDPPAASEDVQERGIGGMPRVMQPVPQNPPSGSSITPMPKVMTPSTPKVTDEAKRVTFSRGETQWISWDYLRTYQPATVATLLSSVKSGAIPASAIAGLVHPNDMQSLLNNPNLVPAASGPQSGPPKFAIQTSAVPSLYSSLPLRSTPGSIDFGPMLVGQSVSSRLHVIAPAAGTMSVVIPDGAFHIRQLISHTGGYRMQQTTVPLANGTTRQAIVSMPIVDQQIAAPPWTIAVKAGQDVEIIIDVTTQRTVKLGEHSSAIQIHHSDGRSTSVPIHARLDGLLYGIGIHMDGLFYVLPGNDLLIPFEWYNDGEQSSATLALENLPTGFTIVTPAPGVTLGKGQRQQSSIVINSGTYITPRDAPVAPLPVLFRVANGPTHLTYTVQIQVVRSWVHQAVGAQAFFDDGERVDVTGFVELRRDGWFLFSGEITSTGVGKGFGISFDSIYRYQVGLVLPRSLTSINVSGSFGHGSLGHSSSTKDTWAQSGMSYDLEKYFIETLQGLSSVEPTIRVTRSTF